MLIIIQKYYLKNMVSKNENMTRMKGKLSKKIPFLVESLLFVEHLRITVIVVLIIVQRSSRKLLLVEKT